MARGKCSGTKCALYKGGECEFKQHICIKPEKGGVWQADVCNRK